mmetsp:Transcript_2601/g.6772  ORF Transcript_2601/g.6772 Transcript_2601/m.6772 type:complete len:308 (-) Transcript_2601:437-1360(-)
MMGVEKEVEVQVLRQNLDGNLHESVGGPRDAEQPRKEVEQDERGPCNSDQTDELRGDADPLVPFHLRGRARLRFRKERADPGQLGRQEGVERRVEDNRDDHDCPPERRRMDDREENTTEGRYALAQAKVERSLGAAGRHIGVHARRKVGHEKGEGCPLAPSQEVNIHARDGVNKHGSGEECHRPVRYRADSLHKEPHEGCARDAAANDRHVPGALRPDFASSAVPISAGPPKRLFPLEGLREEQRQSPRDDAHSHNEGSRSQGQRGPLRFLRAVLLGLAQRERSDGHGHPDRRRGLHGRSEGLVEDL